MQKPVFAAAFIQPFDIFVIHQSTLQSLLSLQMASVVPDAGLSMTQSNSTISVRAGERSELFHNHKSTFLTANIPPPRR